jgi:transposase
MRPPIPIPEHRLVELQDFRKSKWPGFEFQRFLCVWLRVEQGLSTREIARVLNWNVNTIRITQRDFIARGAKALIEEKRGGRRRQLMTIEEEKRFLAAFKDVAESAAMLVANEIQAALEKQLGHTVHKTTVYRLLRRHGWRKVVPRPKHPKQNAEAAEAFKKRASPTE